MNDNLPLVSIVVASYNNGQYLEECLESAVNQTYQNIEIIIADDCSTDNSIEVCQKIIEKYPSKKIILVSNSQNMGACNSLNNVILNYSRGDWIKFLDSDDYLYANAVSDLVNNILLANTDISCAYGITDVLYRNNITRTFGSAYDFRRIISGVNMIPTCASMIKTEDFKKICGFPTDGYVGDFYLWLALSLQEKNFLFVNAIISVYRRNSSPNSMMQNRFSMIMSQAEIFLSLGRKFKKYQYECIETAEKFLNAKHYLRLLEVTHDSVTKGLVYYILHIVKLFKYSSKMTILFVPRLLFKML